MWLTRIPTRRTALLALAGSILGDPRKHRWAVYYGNREPLDSFQPFDTVVFDSRFHPALPPRQGRASRFFGYLSLGEASPDYTYFSELLSAGVLTGTSEAWAGNRFIDVRDKRWRRKVCDELAPWVLSQGFDGIFLDTVDSALALEESDATAFGGMASAAAELIMEIRRRYPGTGLMLNRAYKLLPEIGGSIDVAVGESVMATFDFASKRYVPVRQDWYEQQVGWLRDAKRRNPELLVFTLDYCDPVDSATMRRIYAQERGNGFHPYVSSIDLGALIPEPAG